MNASSILNDSMTLEQKLSAIDEAMKIAQADYNKQNGREASAPVDPAMLTICDGCE